LSGERGIDRTQADLLGDRFGVSAGLFWVGGLRKGSRSDSNQIQSLDFRARVYTFVEQCFLAMLQIAQRERYMTNVQKKRLETQFWNIADSLRGKMNADEFRDDCREGISYNYLSEHQHLYVNEILDDDELHYVDLDEEKDQDYLEAIKEDSIEQLGDLLKLSELIASLAYRALGDKEEEEVSDEDLGTSLIFILDDLTQVLNSIDLDEVGDYYG
jgi:hypothetical protein